MRQLKITNKHLHSEECLAAGWPDPVSRIEWSEEEDDHLWEKTLQGDKNAANELVESMEIHILAIAKRHWIPAISPATLIDAGKEALLKFLLRIGKSNWSRKFFKRYWLW